MRWMLALGMLVVATGCPNSRFDFLVRDRRDNDPVTGPAPTTADLVSYLNNNADRFQSLRVSELVVTVYTPIPVDLRGQLMAQKSRNFLMSANALGKPEVTLGSNDNEFWFHIPRMDPAQWYCTYSDLNEGRAVKMPLPFQPDWLMETIGFGPYGPADRYKLEHDNKTLRLVELAKTPQGRTVRKVIVMNRRPVTAPKAQVTDFVLLDDATNKEIVAVHISEVQVDRGTGAVLPRRMEIHNAADRSKLILTLNGLTLNSVQEGTSFARQPLQGIPSMNLATMRSTSSGLQQVQQFQR